MTFAQALQDKLRDDSGSTEEERRQIKRVLFCKNPQRRARRLLKAEAAALEAIKDHPSAPKGFKAVGDIDWLAVFTWFKIIKFVLSILSFLILVF